MNEQMQLQQEIKAAKESAVAFRWMRLNPSYSPCDANAALMGAWLKENDLEFTEENLDRAAAEIGSRLAHAPVTAAPMPPSEPTLDDVAPIPSWFPRMNSRADIAQIGNEKMKQLMYGPDKEAFKKRLAAIQEGYKPAPRATAVAAVPQAVSHDDGLPPAPAGLDWSMFTTVQQINNMSRESFRHLYHSKTCGAAWRQRVDAIYRRAKEGRQ